MKELMYISLILGLLMVVVRFVSMVLEPRNDFNHSGFKTDTAKPQKASQGARAWLHKWLSNTHSPTYG